MRKGPLRKGAYWLVPHGLLSLHSCPTCNHQPRVGIAHSGLDPPTQIMTQENAPRVSPIKGIPQLTFPLPRQLHLCQVDKN